MLEAGNKNLLTEGEAAQWLKCSKQLLKKWRANPQLPQPAWVRLGKARAVRYPADKLAEFIEKNTVQPRAA